MRKKIVAGNWKMNKTFSESEELVKEILSLLDLKNLPKGESSEVVIIPPFPCIHLCVELINHHARVFAGAQNCYTENSGAFTGEVSALMLQSLGTKYVILGHSERRAIFNESNEFLSKKLQVVLSNQLFPIFCIGETLNERESGIHFDIIKQQISTTLFNLAETEIKKTIIAYEPVWAIGTGMTASPEQAQEIHKFIRMLLSEKFGENTSEEISILYGGSCNAQNAKQLFSMPDIDGGLIGGASLKATDFVTIIESL
jgi:triosephosphate isomerase